MSERNFVVFCAMSEELGALLDDDLRAFLTAKAEAELGRKFLRFEGRLRERAQDAPVPDYAGAEEPADLAQLPQPVRSLFDLEFYPLSVGGRQGYACQSGIGLVNAARAVASALALGGIEEVYYCGTAGGLQADSRVGDVVFGSYYVQHDADATAFGYERGQLPGMPARYNAAEDFLGRARAVADEYPSCFVAPIVSGDRFVTARNVAEVREAFPTARACEMENAAAAQVCWRSDVKFGAVRAVSDLCSPDGDEVFHVNCSQAAAVAANALLKLLSGK